MKSLKAAALAAVLATAGSAHASLIDASAFGGFTTVNMSGVNASLDDFKENVAPFPGDVTHSTSGFYVGAQAAISMMPFLKIGPRVEYIAANRAKFTGTGSGAGVELGMDASLIPLMVGISTDWGIPLTGFSFQGGIWGGYGLAASKLGLTLSGSEYSVLAGGGGFVGEIGAQARYKVPVIPFLSIALDLGYRLANITQMTANAASDLGPLGSYGSGDTLKGANNDPITFDFSGMNVGGAIAFNF